jgi:hypothetical protein
VRYLGYLVDLFVCVVARSPCHSEGELVAGSAEPKQVEGRAREYPLSLIFCFNSLRVMIVNHYVHPGTCAISETMIYLTFYGIAKACLLYDEFSFFTHVTCITGENSMYSEV